MNTWPDGKRRALDQSQHEHWNASHYPGTRQLCCFCDEPTGNCEVDSIFINDEGPMCKTCFDNQGESI